MNILFFIFNLFILRASACEIDIYESIIKLKKSLDQSIIKKSKNCSDKNKIDFIRKIERLQGQVNSQIISQMMQEKVKVTSKVISINNIKNLITKYYPETDYHFSDIKILSSKTFIPFAASTEILCSDCETSGGFKNLKIKNQFGIVLASTFLKKSTWAVVLNKDMRKIGSSLTPQDFQKKKVFINNTQNIFMDIKNIQFYVTNKNLKKNHILRTIDLRPKKLVKIHEPLELHLKSQAISLKTKVVAKEAGILNQTIKVMNPKTNKIIHAKIIGNKKALLSL